MKTKAKRFYLKILLFVVLLCDTCFIVLYLYSFLYHINLTATFEWRPNKLEKTGIFRLLRMGDAKVFITESQILMGGR